MDNGNSRMHNMADKLLVRLLPELKQIIEQDADSLGVHGGMGERAVQILADFYQRPDLRRVPTKKRGRPRLNGKRQKVSA